MRAASNPRAHPGAFGAPMWGQAFSWVTLVLAWLMAFAIGIAIYFLPIVRLLDSFSRAQGRLCRAFRWHRWLLIDDGAPSSKQMGEQYG